MADLFIVILTACELFAKFISGSAKNIIDLRIFAILSNIFGGLLNAFTGAWPQLTQNILETPIHFWRLQRTRRAMREVERAEDPTYAIEIIRKLATTRSYLKDETIFKKGDVAQTAYVLHKGSVKVVEPNVMLSQGSLLGEMGLFIQDNLRTATTVAAEDVVVLEIDYESFEKTYAKNPEIGFAVMRLMARRFAPVPPPLQIREAK